MNNTFVLLIIIGIVILTMKQIENFVRTHLGRGIYQTADGRLVRDPIPIIIKQPTTITRRTVTRPTVITRNTVTRPTAITRNTVTRPNSTIRSYCKLLESKISSMKKNIATTKISDITSLGKEVNEHCT